MNYVIAILGLAVLMVVHEGGHYLAARRFGMRVVRFSIGFGPTLYKHKPEGSPTTYQVALIPFLAYVQIAGMNPYEENDPKDPESYANASLWGRVVTIASGPLVNYLFATVLMFTGYMVGGKIADEHSMRVTVVDHGPAQMADMRTGDKILSVNGEAIADWDSLKRAISRKPGEQIAVGIERAGASLVIQVVPGPKGAKNEGRIMIGPELRAATIGEAGLRSVTEPPQVVADLVVGLTRVVTGKEKAQLSGPVGIVKETAEAAREGPGFYLRFLGMLSAYLGGFNLLPLPALDGGRLLFLGFEAASRRKADAKIEARIHAVGLLMMLTLIAFITYTEVVPKH